MIRKKKKERRRKQMAVHIQAVVLCVFDGIVGEVTMSQEFKRSSE